MVVGAVMGPLVCVRVMMQPNGDFQGAHLPSQLSSFEIKIDLHNYNGICYRLRLFPLLDSTFLGVDFRCMHGCCLTRIGRIW